MTVLGGSERYREAALTTRVRSSATMSIAARGGGWSNAAPSAPASTRGRDQGIESTGARPE
jgi:hypothetical protein